MLLEWEENKADGVSPKVHEKAWDKELTVKGALYDLRQDLSQYANALGVISGVNE